MRLISILYFLLLGYMIATLLFWGHSLNKQSGIIYEHEMATLHRTIDSTIQSDLYKKEFKEIQERENARKRQYFGEGTTFLIVILIAAGVVYSSIRNNNKLVEQQTNFILSITHELKSPIAAIKLNLETIKRRKLEEAMQQKLIERSIAESNRLDDLCNNLILASQIESRHFKPSEELVDLSKLLNENVAVHQQRAKQPIHSNIEENIFTHGDPLLWQLAINNLIENAIKYTPLDNKITVSLHHQDNNLCLSVADEGIGISDAEKEKVFEKFYRVGSEKSRKTKGTGLGLFLTAKIIDQVKGNIIVRNNQPQGTIFEINAPFEIQKTT